MFKKYPALRRKAHEILMDHFSDQDVIFLESIAAYLASAYLHACDDRIGQARDDKMLRCTAGLHKVEAQLVLTIQDIQRLEPLSKEILSRVITGIHEIDELPMGYVGHVDQLVSDLDAKLRQLQTAQALFRDGGEWKRKGGGRPRNEVARAVASVCATIFHEINGARPTVVTDWNTNQARGDFLNFVTDVFKGFDISASPEDAARKAVRDAKEQTRPV